MDAWTWLEEPRCQGRRACVCVRGRGLSGSCYRGLFAFLSGSEIEFHYYVMELSLLHIPHPSLWLARAPTRGCLQAGDRWAAGGQSSHQAGGGQAGTAKDRGWLWMLQKSRKRFSPIFIAQGQKILKEHVLSSDRISQIDYF